MALLHSAFGSDTDIDPSDLNLSLRFVVTSFTRICMQGLKDEMNITSWVLAIENNKSLSSLP